MPNTTPNRHGDLAALLGRLNLAGMAALFADLALKAAKEGLSHEAYLYELARHEEELRLQRRTERLLRQSGLPREKTFRTLNLARLSPALQLQLERLKSGAFLEHACNIIAVGKPGVGKPRSIHYPY
jgi:DNA replication protein DnaC